MKYQSVIGFGKAVFIESVDEKPDVLKVIISFLGKFKCDLCD